MYSLNSVIALWFLSSLSGLCIWFLFVINSVSGTDYASTGIFLKIQNSFSVNLNNLHLARAIVGQGEWWENSKNETEERVKYVIFFVQSMLP